jgi:hypothetical protein
MEVGQGPNWGCSAKEKKLDMKYPENKNLKYQIRIKKVDMIKWFKWVAT